MCSRTYTCIFWRGDSWGLASYEQGWKQAVVLQEKETEQIHLSLQLLVLSAYLSPSMLKDSK